MTRISDLPAAESIEDDDILLLKKANGGDRRITVAELLGQVVTPTFSDSSALRWLARTTVSTAVANVDFSLAYTGYRGFVVKIDSVQPVTDNAFLWALASVDGGSSFLAGTNYAFENLVRDFTGASSNSASGGGAQMPLASGTGVDTDAATSNLCGEFEIYNPTSTTFHKGCAWNTVYKRSDALGNGYNRSDGAAMILTTSAVNALRFQMSTGNIESGTFSLFGVV